MPHRVRTLVVQRKDVGRLVPAAHRTHAPDPCPSPISRYFFFFSFTFYFVSTRRLIASNSAVVSAEVNEGNTQSNDSSISGKLTGPVDGLRATLLDEILAF